MSRKISFSYKGRSFEIKAGALADGWAVRLYEDGRQVSPIRYNVSYETTTDAMMKEFPQDLVEHLMELIKQETASGRLQLLPSSKSK
jgi:hypothetical protein